MQSGPDVFVTYWEEDDQIFGQIGEPINHKELIQAQDAIDLMDQAKAICETMLGHTLFVLVMNRVEIPSA